MSCLFFFCLFGRTQRIGQRGIAEIQKHRFFVNDQWDWNSIRDGKYSCLDFNVRWFECASIQLKEIEGCQMKDIEQQNFQVVMFFTLNL